MARWERYAMLRSFALCGKKSLCDKLWPPSQLHFPCKQRPLQIAAEREIARSLIGGTIFGFCVLRVCLFLFSLSLSVFFFFACLQKKQTLFLKNIYFKKKLFETLMYICFCWSDPSFGWAVSSRNLHILQWKSSPRWSSKRRLRSLQPPCLVLYRKWVLWFPRRN